MNAEDGFGTANFMGKDEDIVKATILALNNGFYHLDCAECMLPPPYIPLMIIAIRDTYSFTYLRLSE